jgi:hypothetical protein
MSRMSSQMAMASGLLRPCTRRCRRRRARSEAAAGGAQLFLVVGGVVTQGHRDGVVAMVLAVIGLVVDDGHRGGAEVDGALIHPASSSPDGVVDEGGVQVPAAKADGRHQTSFSATNTMVCRPTSNRPKEGCS